MQNDRWSCKNDDWEFNIINNQSISQNKTIIHNAQIPKKIVKFEVTRWGSELEQLSVWDPLWSQGSSYTMHKKALGLIRYVYYAYGIWVWHGSKIIHKCISLSKKSQWVPEQLCGTWGNLVPCQKPLIFIIYDRCLFWSFTAFTG